MTGVSRHRETDENNQNAGILLLFVVSHVVVKMAVSFAANTVSRFRSRKLRKKNQSCCKIAFLSQMPTKPNGRLKFFTIGREIEKLKFLYLMLVALLKIMEICPKFSLANMDANALRWL